MSISETLFKDLQSTGVSGVGVSVLCPGFVRTRIAESARNRPNWAPEAEADDVAGAEAMRTAISDMIASGIPPETVAEKVIDAVRTDTFYIRTHPELDTAIATRFSEIMETRPPTITIIG